MRILAIRGEKIASLWEPFELDLEAAPLAGAGLFAIAGPTGSGKSSLLDALCLALFDDAPRVHGATKVKAGRADEEYAERINASDARTLLARGAGSGFAEVDFEGVDRQRYRARWSCRRARGAPGGKLQAAEMVLRALPSEDVLAGDNRTEVCAAIRLRLGFSFEEFCRAVLLAQGDFAAFLQAERGDRAAILEKVTGTERYRLISQAAHQRATAERARREQLQARIGAVVLLEPEAREALAARAGAARERAEAAAGARKAAEAAVAWHERTLQLERASAAAVEALAAEQRGWDAGAAERAELAELERAQSLRAPWLAARESAARAREASGRVEQARAGDAAARDGAERARAAGAAAEAQAREAAARGEELRPAIAEARRLDVALEHAARAARAAVSRREEAGAAAKQAEAAREALERQAREAARELETRRSWLAERAAWSALVDEWPRWRDLLRAHAGARQELERRERALPALAAAAADSASRSAGAADGAARARASAQEGEARRDAAVRQRDEALPRLGGAIDARRRMLDDLREREGLSEKRARLHAGEPCPLCGATEHPWAAGIPAAGLAEDWRRELERLEAEREGLRRSADEALHAAARSAAAAQAAERTAGAAVAEATARARDLADAERAVAELRARVSGEEAQLAAPLAPWDGWRAAVARDAVALERAIAARVDEVIAARAAAEAAREALARCDAQRGPLTTAAERQAAAAAATAEEARREEAEAARLRGARAALLEGRPTSDVEREIEERVRATGERAEVARRAAEEARRAAAQAATAVEERVAEAARAGEAAGVAAAGLEAALAAAELGRERAEALLALGEAEVARRRARTDAATRRLAEAGAVARERAGAVEAHARAGAPAWSAGESTARREAAEAEERTATGERADCEAELKRDDAARSAVAALRPELEAQEREARRWESLSALIGASNGAAFRDFAQGLTLDALLVEANAHLRQLSPRYRLQRVPGADLDLQVTDQDLGGDARNVNGLSGGETFLVSLGLALGLSGLSARAAHVQTLFIDEGFGTLDPETLDQAMATLESLQATGRTVGIISHVREMHERVGVRVEVEPRGGGRSTLRVAIAG